MSWLDQLQRPEAETGQERITGSVEPELGPNDDPSSMLLPVRLQSILHQTPVPQCLDCRMSPDDQLLGAFDHNVCRSHLRSCHSKNASSFSTQHLTINSYRLRCQKHIHTPFGMSCIVVLPMWCLCMLTRVTTVVVALSLFPCGLCAALRDRRKTVKIREVSTGNTVERMVFPNVIE